MARIASRRILGGMAKTARQLDDAERARAEERFRWFIRDRGKDLGEARGWKKQVAKEAGITPEHLSRIIAGRRGVSLATLEHAANALSFRLDYFFAEDPPGGERLTYRDFLRTRLEIGRRAYAREGRKPSLSPDEMRALANRVNDSFRAGELDGEAARELASAVVRMPVVQDAQELLEIPSNDDRQFQSLAVLIAGEVLMLFLDLHGRDT